MTIIKCKIDMPEAIRRGFNCEDKMNVCVNVAGLPFKARDVLAAHLMGSNFKSPTTHHWPAIPEPTEKGFLETLTRMVEETEPKEEPLAEEEPGQSNRGTARYAGPAYGGKF